MKVSSGRRRKPHPNLGALETASAISLHSGFVGGRSGDQQRSRRHLPGASQWGRAQLLQRAQEPAHPAPGPQPLDGQHHRVRTPGKPTIGRPGRLQRRGNVLRRGSGRPRLPAAQCHRALVPQQASTQFNPWWRKVWKTSKTWVGAHGREVLEGFAAELLQWRSHMGVANCVQRCACSLSRICSGRV